MVLEVSTILWSFFLTLMASVIILVTVKYHGRWSHDVAHGVQKFHESPTPRIGGIAIFLGVMIGFFVQADGLMRQDFLAIMACSVLPFVVGVREDLFKVASVKERLLAMIVASVIIIVLTKTMIHQVDVPVIDQLLSLPIVAAVFTIFAVTGITNAINIVDGFNGLASGISLYIFLFFAAIALNVGDADMAELCLILVIAIVAFMLLNFPFGKIFLGDSGAYFVGFCLAWFAVMLVHRNPTVSPWAPLLITAYPVMEVTYSMYRRIRIKMSSTLPDNEHLHSLIKTRLIRRFCFGLPAWLRNSLVSPLVWVSNIAVGLLGVTYQSDTPMLMIFFALFMLVYVLTHKILLMMPDYDAMGR